MRAVLGILTYAYFSGSVLTVFVAAGEVLDARLTLSQWAAWILFWPGLVVFFALRGLRSVTRHA